MPPYELAPEVVNDLENIAHMGLWTGLALWRSFGRAFRGHRKRKGKNPIFWRIGQNYACHTSNIITYSIWNDKDIALSSWQCSIKAWTSWPGCVTA